MCEKASLVKSAQGAEAGAAAAKAVVDNEAVMEQREKPIKHEGNVTVTTKPKKNEKYIRRNTKRWGRRTYMEQKWRKRELERNKNSERKRGEEKESMKKCGALQMLG